MAKIVILNIEGDDQLYAADLDSGTVTPVTGEPVGELATLLSLTETGAVVTKAVKAAIALDPSATIASSFHEG